MKKRERIERLEQMVLDLLNQAEQQAHDAHLPGRRQTFRLHMMALITQREKNR